MGHIWLAYGNAVLAGPGLARLDLFLRFSPWTGGSNRYLSRIDVDSGIQPLSGYSSGYLFIDYLADPNRVQMAAQVDDHLLCVFCDANFPNEAAWQDGPARGITVRYGERSIG